MPQPKKGARLGGSAAHQRHIIANLCKDLIHHRSIRTTEAKAKAVQPYMERLITKAKKGDTHNRREIIKTVGDRETAYILVEELGPIFAERQGGYTRIIKVGNRRGDNAPMAVISLVTEKLSPKQSVVREAEKAAQNAAKKEEADKTEEAAQEETVEAPAEEAAAEVEAPAEAEEATEEK